MTTADVPVVGETVIDVVEQDGNRREHVGGSPALVALTLARLGRSVGFATDLGDDARGSGRARTSAPRCACPRDGAGSTSSAVARIGADGSARYDFDLSWDPDPVDPGGARHVHTGSAAAFLAPGPAGWPT
ncbi:hypothetical protein Q0F99_07210 [Rathayibacter oskolensis]|nr:hypothetical protein [Rathayibacter oskolensis]WKK72702.1 hypothetical protein Q0F99_07210 [Rathayibacter oskolensis]